MRIVCNLINVIAECAFITNAIRGEGTFFIVAAIVVGLMIPVTFLLNKEKFLTIVIIGFFSLPLLFVIGILGYAIGFFRGKPKKETVVKEEHWFFW